MKADYPDIEWPFLGHETVEDSTTFEFGGVTWHAEIGGGIIEIESEDESRRWAFTAEWDDVSGEFIGGGDLESVNMDDFEDVWEALPEDWWRDPRDPEDDLTWEVCYVVQVWDDEAGWRLDERRFLKFREALEAYEATEDEAKRLIYREGDKEEIIARPSFVKRLRDTFPGLDKETARRIAESRNPDNEDPFLVAQAWVRHHLTEYEDLLQRAADLSGDEFATDSERAAARRTVREKVDAILRQWSQPKKE